MIEYIALGTLAAFSVIGPPIVRGGNRAWHNPIKVTLPHDNVTLEQNNHPEGRRAQEVGHWRLNSLIATIIASGPLFAADGVFAALGAVVAWFVAKLVLYETPIGDLLDTASHGAEILVAEEDGLWSYREAEIIRMLNDPKRSGKTFEEVHAEVASMEWLSKIMVKLAW